MSTASDTAAPAVAPPNGGTMTLLAEITVSTEGLAAEVGLPADQLIPFVQGIVARSLAGYPDLLSVEWKPGYRTFVRTVAELSVEGELQNWFEPPEPFVNTFDDAVETLNRLITDARELFDS